MQVCPKCGAPMDPKAEVDLSEVQSAIFYQCPKCKNVELRALKYNGDLRLAYP